METVFGWGRENVGVGRELITFLNFSVTCATNLLKICQGKDRVGMSQVE